MSTEPKPTPTEMAVTVWSLGTYDAVAADYLPAAATLVARAGVTPDDAVLDVACGSGNVALTAWREGARVTGLDLTPAMLELARENASIMGAAGVDWRTGEATSLPFEDDAFDVSLLCFGPEVLGDGEAAFREMARVTRSGGRVATAAWSPAVETIFAVPASYLAEPPRLADFSWGDAERVAGRLEGVFEHVDTERGELVLPHLSPAHFWQHLTANAGPFIAMLGQVEEADRPAVAGDAVDAIEPFFEANTVRLPYLVATGAVP